MSVYTALSHEDLSIFLAKYSIGELVNFEGIDQGIENTNYFVDTSEGSYVLTIFESLENNDLPFFLELMSHLSRQGIPCAKPLPDKNNNYLQNLKDKPSAIVERLVGTTLIGSEASESQCQQVGMWLAKLHQASLSFKKNRINNRGKEWFKKVSESLYPKIKEEEKNLLHSEIDYQLKQDTKSLPSGIIHADLFRDNVMFDNSTLTGIIDFYYAYSGAFLYDLAVTVNDWCIKENGEIHLPKCKSLLRAYINIRKIESKEYKHWSLLLRAAALRFWTSRLYDKHFPKDGVIIHTKDPDIFKKILLDRIEKKYNWPFNLD